MTLRSRQSNWGRVSLIWHPLILRFLNCVAVRSSFQYNFEKEREYLCKSSCTSPTYIHTHTHTHIHLQEQIRASLQINISLVYSSERQSVLICFQFKRGNDNRWNHRNVKIDLARSSAEDVTKPLLSLLHLSCLKALTESGCQKYLEVQYFQHVCVWVWYWSGQFGKHFACLWDLFAWEHITALSASGATNSWGTNSENISFVDQRWDLFCVCFHGNLQLWLSVLFSGTDTSVDHSRWTLKMKYKKIHLLEKMVCSVFFL